MRSVRRPRQPRSSERGAFGILYAIILPVMLGMVGLAVDLSIVYARSHELQAIADGAALAAARALDGTAEGLATAEENARRTARLAKYRFLDAETIEWSVAALSFGPTVDGPWSPANAVAAGDVPNMRFARVDTAGLNTVYGRVSATFLQVVGVSGEQNLSRSAVAGRKDSSLAPLALCALNPAERSGRLNAAGAEELLEFGFRRGVGYNLLNIGPATQARNYIVNPVDFAPAPAIATHMDDAAIRPFVCTGTMHIPLLQAGSILYVREGFPAAWAAELNSRFGNYNGGSICNKYGAPPDSNIIEFRGGYPQFWMPNGRTATLRASAMPLDESSAGPGSDKRTIADVDPVPGGTVAGHYGPLWAFSRPLRYNSATDVVGPPFTRTDWASLYPVGTPPAPSSNYNRTIMPYELNAAPNRLSPLPLHGMHQRRVLNVPLLACPANGATRATMVAIGRFMMTSPATVAPAAIHAEFGGLVNYNMLTASAVLYK